MKRQRYAWVTIMPATWLVICTLTAGWQKLFHESPSIGFLALARKFGDAAAEGRVIAPAKSMQAMHQIVFNNYLDAGLCALFMAIVVAMIGAGIVSISRALSSSEVSTKEVGYDKDLGPARA
jgi:carbon starvation protein